MRGRAATALGAAVAAVAVVSVGSSSVHAGSTSSFADLPAPVYLDIGLGNPVGPFGPLDFDFGSGQVVTATLDEDAMSCPQNIGSFGEEVTHGANPADDPGDHQGRTIRNVASCPNQTMTLDFSEPVRAIGVSFKHYSCGFLQQGDRTIVAYDGPGGSGNVIGTASTDGNAIPCFAIWIDFVGVISDQADIQSMQILSDTDHTLITGMALSAGDPTTPCPADLNDDGNVDVNDLLGVLADWGMAGGPNDVNGDGIVGIDDLLMVLGAWGAC